MHAIQRFTLLTLLALPVQAQAAEERAFDIPRGNLSSVLPVVSRQAGRRPGRTQEQA